jgi:hypothetical protein
MSSRVFNIDYKKLIVLLLPPFLRQSILFAFLKVLTKPVVTLYDSFLTNREENIYKINHTGQVCYLRKLLNDAFDVTDRRIYIEDGSVNDWKFVYKKSTFNATDNGIALMMSEADSVSTDTLGNSIKIFLTDNDGITLISTQGNVGSSGVDFLVLVPGALSRTIDKNKMIAFINYYKLASKRYTITYY